MENKEFKIYDGDVIVNVEITEEKKDKVFNEILKWCEKYNCVNGEKLHQNDNCIIESPSLISDIIDNIMDFKVKCEDEF
jgi:hypothetical protein